MLVVSETEISWKCEEYLNLSDSSKWTPKSPRRLIYAEAVKHEKWSKEIISTQSAIDINAESLPAIGD